MGMLFPQIYCQFPIQPIHQLPLNLLNKICEKKQRLLTKADWKMTDILEVQNNLMGKVVATPLYFLCTSFTSTLKPCRQMTKKNMNMVARRLDKLGEECRQKAWQIAAPLFGLVKRRWMSAITDPQNSVPYSDLMVMGLRERQTMFYEMLTAINRDIPEPKPQPFCSISSSRMTMKPEDVSCMIISIAFPIPISDTDPQAPDHVQAKAQPNAIIIANNFCEPSQSFASRGLPISKETMPVPMSSCRIQPAETTGESPSSMRVPRLEARMTLIQQKGSLPYDRSTPQMGIWQQTRQINSVMAVQSIFYLLLTKRLGLSMKGKMLIAGSRTCNIRNPIYGNQSIIRL